MNYRLPLGGYTERRSEYFQAWETLLDKAERFFPSYEVQSYDPMIQMTRRDRNAFRYTCITLTPESVADLSVPDEILDQAVAAEKAYENRQ